MNMFSIFKKDPIKKLDKLYESKLEEAMYAQRKGDIKSYAMITAEAEKIKVQILELQTSTKT
jgi:hypothetical protein